MQTTSSHWQNALTTVAIAHGTAVWSVSMEILEVKMVARVVSAQVSEYQHGNGQCIVAFCIMCMFLDTCDLPKEVGRCRGSFPRYFHNLETRQCEQFIYGGCGGNANNFLTSEDCFNTCHPCPLIKCLTAKCTFGFKKTDDGCQTCDCLRM